MWERWNDKWEFKRHFVPLFSSSINSRRVIERVTNKIPSFAVPSTMEPENIFVKAN